MLTAAVVLQPTRSIGGEPSSSRSSASACGELLEDRLRMLDEAPARRCEAHALRAPLEQRDAGLHLELRQLLGDRGRA